MSLLATQLLGETNFGSPTGVTTQDHEVLRLWHLVYWFAIPIAAIVAGLVVWCIVRYRVRPGRQDPPKQFQYHIPIEAAYTIIPIVIVAIIFGFLYGAENREDAVAKDPALVVHVEGFQWGWRFIYPNGHQQVGDVTELANIDDTANLPVLYLPQNETVQLDLKSDDVVHGFYIPEFLFQRDLIPGVKNTVDFNVTKTGTWIGECTNICGTYHAYMRFKVTVLPDGQFNHWLSQQKPGSITNSGPSDTHYSNDLGGNA